MLPLRTDLFTTPPPSEPAPCGFIPTLGWSSKRQRDFHIAACADCKPAPDKEADAKSLEAVKLAP